MTGQNRFKSPVLWGAVVAQVLAILTTLGVFGTSESGAIEQVIAAVLQLLTVFGVLNNPTDKGHF